MCQTIGKLNMPSSPNSRVKNPKKLILIADNTMTQRGKIKEIKMSILLVLFKSNFCNSNCNKRIICYL